MTNSPTMFHRLYGIKRPKVTYYKRDFLDYVLMIVLSGLVVSASYGVGSIMSIVGLMLCAFALVMFIIRHGIAFRVPVILRRPQEILYMFVYKVKNLRPMYFVAVGLLLLENSLIAATPNLPHHVDLVRKVAFCLFYVHFISITPFTPAILTDHLANTK